MKQVSEEKTAEEKEGKAKGKVTGGKRNRKKG